MVRAATSALGSPAAAGNVAIPPAAVPAAPSSTRRRGRRRWAALAAAAVASLVAIGVPRLFDDEAAASLLDYGPGMAIIDTSTGEGTASIPDSVVPGGRRRRSSPTVTSGCSTSSRCRSSRSSRRPVGSSARSRRRPRTSAGSRWPTATCGSPSTRSEGCTRSTSSGDGWSPASTTFQDRAAREGCSSPTARSGSRAPRRRRGDPRPPRSGHRRGAASVPRPAGIVGADVRRRRRRVDRRFVR